MFLSDGWKEYELLDCTNGEKLERWGGVLLIRPDPQVIWSVPKPMRVPEWKQAAARYVRSKSGGGHWQTFHSLPQSWTVAYRDLTFGVKPMGFKHTGLFPEQAANWDWFSGLIQNSGRKEINVLNLFAYTGGATIAAAAAGAKVCHVDAAKGMVSWARENAALSGLGSHPIRYIVDDVKKFVEREIRRGRVYDAVIMDPPSYGRGPGGEVWKIEAALFELLELCVQVLSRKPLFFLVNSYTTGLSGSVLHNCLKLTLGRRFGGRIAVDEVGLPITNGGLVLPCGFSARWQA